MSGSLTVGDTRKQLELNEDHNSFSFKQGSFNLKQCRSRVIADNQTIDEFNWQVIDHTDCTMVMTGKNCLGKWKLDLRLNEDSLSLELSGKLKKNIRDLKIYPFCCKSIKIDHLLAQGRYMGGCRSLEFPQTENSQLDGYYQLMLTRNSETMQLAFPMQQKYPARFTGKIVKNGLKDLKAGYEIKNAASGTICGDPLEIKVSENGHWLMIDWGDRSLEAPKKLAGEPKPGWNSWDYYRWTITEEEVLKNAEFIANDPVLSKHVKRIIVDDGWQYCYGEWDANPKFPHGMEYLARRLNEMGFEAGLWFAPTIIEPHAHIAQLHDDMLAMGESGLPCLAYSCMERKGFVLDPTREKVQKWLYDLFKRYADMGYTYFKLDFLCQTLKAKKFFKQDIPHSRIMREIVKPIHKAVDGKARILGCNYMFEGGTKYVDYVRVGSDIHATWACTKNNVISAAARFWSNQRLWINDADFAVCRGPETSNARDVIKPALVYITPEEQNPPPITYATFDSILAHEAEVLLSIVIITGSSINLSDNLTELNARGLDLIRRTVSADIGGSGIPLDLFQHSLPSYWLQKVKDYHRALLVNWSDEEQEMTMDLAQHNLSPASAVNFWNDQPVAINNGELSCVLKPHSCLLVNLN